MTDLGKSSGHVLPDPNIGHVVEGTGSVLRQDGNFWPTLWCSCGYAAHGDPKLGWQDAGAEMDEHLKGVPK